MSGIDILTHGIKKNIFAIKTACIDVAPHPQPSIFKCIVLHYRTLCCKKEHLFLGAVFILVPIK